ncbi:alkaline phosphatase [Brotaphodocola sp.]|uniref:alkaline phosphatase n=1 Tax=Brotaphodocola sp. TaxID=3073577 RepID=UPI003D7D2DEA
MEKDFKMKYLLFLIIILSELVFCLGSIIGIWKFREEEIRNVFIIITLLTSVSFYRCFELMKVSIGLCISYLCIYFIVEKILIISFDVQLLTLYYVKFVYIIGELIAYMYFSLLVLYRKNGLIFFIEELAILFITFLFLGGTGLYFRDHVLLQNEKRINCDLKSIIQGKEKLIDELNEIPKIENLKEGIENQILFIGDGMGKNHVQLAKRKYGYDFLNMEKLSIQGECSTFSLELNGPTDSAAAATAMSTGYKTKNGYIGLNKEKIKNKNLVQYCQENRIAVGIVCTDFFWGATPAAFCSYATDRNDSLNIFEQEVNKKINLFIAQRDQDLWNSVNSKKNDSIVFTTDSTLNYEALNTYAKENMSLYCGISGHYNGCSYDETEFPELSTLVKYAIYYMDSLVKLNQEQYKAYLLIVEGSHIDKFSAKNMLDDTLAEVMEFDKAIGTALEEIDENKVSVFVTADHECGGLVLNDHGNGSFTTTKHTAVNVPYYASIHYKGLPQKIDNTNICTIIKQKLK